VEASTADTVARAEAAARWRRPAALGCLVTGLAWGVVVVRRMWPEIRAAIRSKLDDH
jgi:hypothetical protein